MTETQRSTPPPISHGTVINDRYEIRQSLGKGGMGEVCLADDLMLDRQVALKFLTCADETGSGDRLLAEARAAAALDHPFICSIYEVTVINNRPCIAMIFFPPSSPKISLP